MPDAGTPFLGEWVDDSGRRLRIDAAGAELRASFFDRQGNPLRRTGVFSFLKGRAVDLPASLSGEALVVELDTPGLGPTLHLTAREHEGVPVLVPQAHIGLYGDFEDDLGVPWVMPLSLYRRAAAGAPLT